MKRKIQGSKRPIKINTLFSHNLQVSANTRFSPLPKNITKCDELQISPSLRKTQLPTSSRNKFKKSPSKLFQSAHQTTECETFLARANSVALQRFASSQKAGKKIEKNPNKGVQKRLSISNQFNITIKALQGVAELSLIINLFQNGIFGGLDNITENSEQLLQLHSKTGESQQKVGGLQPSWLQ